MTRFQTEQGQINEEGLIARILRTTSHKVVLRQSAGTLNVIFWGDYPDGTVCWFRTSYLQSHNLALYQVS